jgi:hypothetical protein
MNIINKKVPALDGDWDLKILKRDKPVYNNEFQLITHTLEISFSQEFVLDLKAYGLIEEAGEKLKQQFIEMLKGFEGKENNPV